MLKNDFLNCYLCNVLLVAQEVLACVLKGGWCSINRVTDFTKWRDKIIQTYIIRPWKLCLLAAFIWRLIYGLCTQYQGVY